MFVGLERILGRGMGKEEFLGVGNRTGLFALSSKTSLKTYMSLLLLDLFWRSHHAEAALQAAQL